MFCPLIKEACNKDCVFYTPEKIEPLTVDELNLSVRAINCLKNCLPKCTKPMTVIAWKQISFGWLMKQPGIGKATAREIINELGDLEYTSSVYGSCSLADAVNKFNS